MAMLIYSLTLCVIISAVLHIRADYAGERVKTYIFKPLTVICIILICMLKTPGGSPTYRYIILTGLLLSLVGDIFLMQPTDQFIKGLASFLLAHICYIIGFSSVRGFGFSIACFIPSMVFGGIMLTILLPHTGRMKIPVIVYATVIALMLWQALERWVGMPATSSLYALTGALFFVFSDTILAYNRFVKKFRAAQLVILSTYYCAQWWIGMSV